MENQQETKKEDIKETIELCVIWYVISAKYRAFQRIWSINYYQYGNFNYTISYLYDTSLFFGKKP